MSTVHEQTRQTASSSKDTGAAAATPGASAGALHEALNRQVANWSVLYVKLHRFHWYVQGPQFFTLHAKFQALYEEAAGRVDELAERLLAVGGRPAASMAEYLKLASVREDGGDDAASFVAALAADFTALAGELAADVKTADAAGDDVSADLLTGILGSVQKHLWMLRAFQG